MLFSCLFFLFFSRSQPPKVEHPSVLSVNLYRILDRKAMSACGSLQHIFENPLPENPTLLESLSWNQIKPVKSIEHSSSFTEIFGELHFKDSPESSPSSSSSSPNFSTSSFTSEIDHTKQLSQNEVSGSSDINQTYVSSTPITNHTNSHKSSDSFSSLNSESLQICTEGLGFESSDEVEDLKTGMNKCWQTHSEKEAVKKHVLSEESYGECRTKSRVSGGEYPPPISCIGRTGKPGVCFRSYRNNGRFVLKEIRIPTQELLHAYREDGRLKLHFVQPDDEFIEEEEEEEEEEDNDDDVESIDEGEKNMGKENDDCVTDQVNEDNDDDVESIDEGEKNMGKENDDCVTDQVNEEREIDA